MATVAGATGSTFSKDRVRPRIASDAPMVQMLSARFSGRALRGAFPNGPTQTGNLNAAPPNPISPPGMAIETAEAHKWTDHRRNRKAVPRLHGTALSSTSIRSDQSASISTPCFFAARLIRFLIVSTSSASYFAALSLWFD
jgi:hypothetical protein